MDAKEFVRETKRMCNTYSLSCDHCPLDSAGCAADELNEDTVDIVEQWSINHPIVTNRMKFEEVFGDKLEFVQSSDPREGMMIFPFGWWDEPYTGDSNG